MNIKILEKMEEERKSGSSLASDLFGPNDSSSSSAGIFASIFAPPPSKALGLETLRSFQNDKKNSSDKNGLSDSYAVGSEGQNKSKESRSYYPEENQQPFHYSTSIYYGGQDVYFRPESAHNPVTTKKDGGEDDSGSASRGNWWQGRDIYIDKLVSCHKLSAVEKEEEEDHDLAGMTLTNVPLKDGCMNTEERAIEAEEKESIGGADGDKGSDDDDMDDGNGENNLVDCEIW